MTLFPAARLRSVGEDDDLLESGILDSLGILDLVSRLEATFGITVLDEDLVPDNFRSLRHLAAFVLGRLDFTAASPPKGCSSPADAPGVPGGTPAWTS
jgi:acyl carrier protein